MKNRITLRNIPTLREIEVALKKLDMQIALHKAFAKEGTPNILLDMLINERQELVARLQQRTDPKNAARCSLPKKQQRKLGLIPQV